MKNIYIYLMLIIFVAFGVACNTKQQGNTNVQTQGVENSQKSNNTKLKKVSFVIDDTGSSSIDLLSQPTVYTKSALTKSENVIAVDVFNIGGNGKHSWESVQQHFEIPLKPTNKFNKDEAIAFAKEYGCGDRLMCIDSNVEKAQKQAQIDYENELNEYRQVREELIAKIGEAILQAPSQSPPCSDIQEQAEFVAQSPSDVVIWLTDGQHNCKTPFAGMDFKHKTVLIGVLPIKNEVAGGFGKRFSELTAKFHNAQIKPITSLNTEFISELIVQ